MSARAWPAEACLHVWERVTQAPADVYPDGSMGWSHRFGNIVTKTPTRMVTCAACSQPIAAGTPALWADEVSDRELWTPARRYLHRERCS